MAEKSVHKDMNARLQCRVLSFDALTDEQQRACLAAIGYPAHPPDADGDALKCLRNSQANEFCAVSHLVRWRVKPSASGFESALVWDARARAWREPTESDADEPSIDAEPLPDPRVPIIANAELLLSLAQSWRVFAADHDRAERSDLARACRLRARELKDRAQALRQF